MHALWAGAGLLTGGRRPPSPCGARSPGPTWCTSPRTAPTSRRARCSPRCGSPTDRLRLQLDAGDQPAPCVVLSACEAGLATVRPGDEGLGLTSVLLHLGSRSVLAGVARVRDDVAARVMERARTVVDGGRDEQRAGAGRCPGRRGGAGAVRGVRGHLVGPGRPDVSGARRCLPGLPQLRNYVRGAPGWLFASFDHIQGFEPALRVLPRTIEHQAHSRSSPSILQERAVHTHASRFSGRGESRAPTLKAGEHP